MNDDLAKLVTAAASSATFTDKRDFRAHIAAIERKAGVSRRAFLGGLLGAAASAAVIAADPERLLWTPGGKSLFLPPTEVIPVSTEDMDLVIRFIGELVVLQIMDVEYSENGVHMPNLYIVRDVVEEPKKGVIEP